MLYREIIAVCSQIHTKHINTVCGQNVQLLNVKLAVQTSSTRVPNFRKSLYDPFQLKIVVYQHSPYCQPVDCHQHFNVPLYCTVSPWENPPTPTPTSDKRPYVTTVRTILWSSFWTTVTVGKLKSGFVTGYRITVGFCSYRLLNVTVLG
jgi:hypothetical protein